MHLFKYMILLLPIIWLWLLSVKVDASWFMESTLEKLQLMTLEIDQFYSEYHRLPDNVSEIRSYILSHDKNFTPYDDFGLRLQYMRLSEDEYFVKSFGPDQAINQPKGEKDLTLVKMKPQKRIPASQDMDKSYLMKLFPAPLLVGNRPPNKNYFALLIPDEIRHTRKLVVRGLSDSNFIITSFHDSVEEFLWLKDGKTLVFTASGSPRYQDGIYLWDISSNTTVNILSKLQQNYFTPEQDKYYFSLSHSDYDSNGVYFYAVAMESASLDPLLFFHLRNLYKLTNSDTGFSIDNFSESISITDTLLSPQDQLRINPLSLNLQKEWKHLVIDGSITTTINDWQVFCAKYTQVAIGPYCLLWLTILYNDAGLLLLPQHPDEASIMLNYALETAALMDQHINIPEYLRAIGNHFHIGLRKRQFFNFPIANFSQDISD